MDVVTGSSPGGLASNGSGATGGATGTTATVGSLSSPPKTYDPYGTQGLSWALPRREGGCVAEIYFATGDANAVTNDDGIAMETVSNFYEKTVKEPGTPPLKLLCVGYADHRQFGGAGGNQALSIARANRVADYLRARMPSSSKLTIKSAGNGVHPDSHSLGSGADELEAFRRTMVFASPQPDVKTPIPPVPAGLPRDTLWKARVLRGGRLSPGTPAALVFYEIEISQRSGKSSMHYEFRAVGTPGRSVTVTPSAWSTFTTRSPYRVNEFQGWGCRFAGPWGVVYAFMGEDGREKTTVRFTDFALSVDIAGGTFHPSGSIKVAP